MCVFPFSPWPYHSRPLIFFLPVPSRTAGCCRTWTAKLTASWATTTRAMKTMAHFSAAICPHGACLESWWGLTLKEKNSASCFCFCYCLTEWVSTHLLVSALVFLLVVCLCLEAWFWLWRRIHLMSGLLFELSSPLPEENCELDHRLSLKNTKLTKEQV